MTRVVSPHHEERRNPGEGAEADSEGTDSGLNESHPFYGPWRVNFFFLTPPVDCLLNRRSESTGIECHWAVSGRIRTNPFN